jgi:hypothetical protein
MSKHQRGIGPWVVYQTAVHGHLGGANAVCEQFEWDAMEKDQPGHHTLIKAGITSEGEAERLARGKSGDTVPRVPGGRRTPRPEPGGDSVSGSAAGPQ